MKTHSIMIQGTGSDAGKSTITAGLCRLLNRRGIKVAPFKPQNMALNSAVTDEGGEIGRAQAFQALAANTPAHVDMNPVLIKPSSDTGAQIIINGKPYQNMDARQYQLFKPRARSTVIEAFHNLSRRYQYVVIEGAGSPAEINLRENDIANMGFAESIDCPVVLVGDIDKGGVFAQFVGTLQCLSESERKRITGFIINRFRGDLSILQDGLNWLEAQTGKPVFGVLPYLHGIQVAAEDAISTEQQTASDNSGMLNVIVPVLPHISNHTDFDPLRMHPNVNLQYIGPDQHIPAADLIVLPGSKTVIQDLHWLRQQGWEQVINRHLRYGGKVIGICGGYQMLGKSIDDPRGVEGNPGKAQGLGLLDIETTLRQSKTLRQVSGRLCIDHSSVSGYEIHMGVTRRDHSVSPLITTDENNEAAAGALSADGRVAGTYLHGLFDSADACSAILRWAGAGPIARVDYHDICQHTIDRIADSLEKHVNINALLECCQAFQSTESPLQLTL